MLSSLAFHNCVSFKHGWHGSLASKGHTVILGKQIEEHHTVKDAKHQPIAIMSH